MRGRPDTSPSAGRRLWAGSAGIGGLTGDLQKGQQSLHVARGEVGNRQFPLCLPDGIQTVLVDFLFGHRLPWGVRVGALAEEDPGAEGLQGLHEALAGVPAVAVKADVSGIGNPAGGGLQGEAGGPEDGVVQGPTLQGDRWRFSVRFQLRSFFVRFGGPPEPETPGADEGGGGMDLSFRRAVYEDPLAPDVPFASIPFQQAVFPRFLRVDVGHAGGAGPARILHGFGDEGGHPGGEHRDFRADEEQVAGMVQVGVGKEDGVHGQPVPSQVPIARSALEGGPEGIGGAQGGDQVVPVQAFQRGDEAQREDVQHPPGRPLPHKDAVKVVAVAAEGPAEIQEDAGLSVLYQDFAAADFVDAAVEGDDGHRNLRLLQDGQKRLSSSNVFSAQWTMASKGTSWYTIPISTQRVKGAG